ncbi:MAG TPA: DUF4331 family protein [bacterium]|nr:DUF4331 family protein [bacterium]
MNTRIVPPIAVVAAILLGWGVTPSQASSHREAPGISQKPAYDNTDVYFFVSPTNPNNVTIVGCWWPMEEAAGGPNFFHFDEDADYAFNIDNDGDARPDISFVFRFNTKFENPQSALYAGGEITSLDDADWNYRQTYSVFRVDHPHSRQLLAGDLIVPPVNVGPRTTPNYESLIGDAIYELPNGIKVFAGQRDDPFFVDLGAIFDLLGFRAVPGNVGQGRDDLAGYNCQAIVMEVPIAMLTSNKTNPSNPADPAAILGLWSTTRVGKQELSTRGTGPGNSGDDLAFFSNRSQVSRLGMPLVNEVVIPIGKKDLWNASSPKKDGQFLSYVQDPELAKAIEALYGVTAPPAPRCDLVAVFLTGVPDLNQPAGVVPAEEMRLNVAIKHDQVEDSRFGVLGGDLDGFPNGRRLTDDIVDISERAVAGALYPLFCDPSFTPHPLAAQLGDGIDENDLEFLSEFPYLATPHSGWEHEHNRIEPPHDPERTPPPSRLGTQVTGDAQLGRGASIETKAATFELSMPTPNPAARGSEIAFSIPQKSEVQLRIFDVTGRQVRTLIDGEIPAGAHTAKWDGADEGGQRVAAGIYLVQLTAPNQIANRKVTVVR